MSRAFVKEDVDDAPERSGRVRSASGLPAGAANYMTGNGARKLRERIARLHSAGNAAEIVELEAILASATVVEIPEAPSSGIAFGATVTVSNAAGKLETYRIVGVDEVEPGAVSWISPIGKTLLAAEMGERVKLGDDTVTIVRVEY